MSQDLLHQFLEAMREHGLVPPNQILADGVIHRCGTRRKPDGSDGAYSLAPSCLGGGFQDWSDCEGWQHWKADLERDWTPEEQMDYQAGIEAARKLQHAEAEFRRDQAKEEALRIWEASVPVEEHPYLQKKGVMAHLSRLVVEGDYKGCLVVPVCNMEGGIETLQFIAPDGAKRFLPGGAKHGNCCLLGVPTQVIYVAEGFATGASIHEATNEAVVVAFDAGNLLPVAQNINKRNPAIELIFCADDDASTPGNPGITKATEAALATGGQLASPDFGSDRPQKVSDFNDLHSLLGIEAVRRCLANRVPPWPQPQPLRSAEESQPYPIHAFPPLIRDAVEDVHGFVQAPVSLVSSCALGALSLAGQAHGDVRRCAGLTGPIGLFLLVVADSGERKSTCDSYFFQPIRDFEREADEACKPLMLDYKAEMEAWEARRNGLKDRIRLFAKKGTPSGPAEAELRDLEQNKPEPPRVPRMIYNDVTPEKLRWNLAEGWSSAGVISSEAGLVLGSHGMGQESALRNLATMNTLWDGQTIQTDRRTSESFRVEGARLTMTLQIQGPAFRSFFDRAGDLARGTGFTARFLIACPESTQGTRLFRDPPDDFPGLNAFTERLKQMLERAPVMDKHGSLHPPLIDFSEEAKHEWIHFHDSVEVQLASGGKFEDVRDVASKIADNAARVAALFHLLEGVEGDISLATVKAACTITRWYLDEARRFFGDLSIPDGIAKAACLEDWLLKRCQQVQMDRVSTQEVQQRGPNALREKSVLDSAIQVLESHGRIRRVQDGQRKLLVINPGIMKPKEPFENVPAEGRLTLAHGHRESSGNSSSESVEPDPAPASGGDSPTNSRSLACQSVPDTSQVLECHRTDKDQCGTPSPKAHHIPGKRGDQAQDGDSRLSWLKRKVVHRKMPKAGMPVLLPPSTLLGTSQEPKASLSILGPFDAPQV